MGAADSCDTCRFLLLDPITDPGMILAVNGPLYILLNVYVLEEGLLWTKLVLRMVIPWCPACVPTKFNPAGDLCTAFVDRPGSFCDLPPNTKSITNGEQVAIAFTGNRSL